VREALERLEPLTVQVEVQPSHRTELAQQPVWSQWGQAGVERSGVRGNGMKRPDVYSAV